MIAIIFGLWLSFLLGFVGALWLFPRVECNDICPVCNRKMAEHTDEWA